MDVESNELEPLSAVNANKEAPLSEEVEMFSVYFFSAEKSDGFTQNPRNFTKSTIFRTPNMIASIASSMNGTMPKLASWIDLTSTFAGLLHFLEWNLRSIGQVYFCNNPISGLFIVAGLFVQSTRVAIHGLIGLITGNTLAILIGFDKGLISSGLFGYNSVLVGLATSTFYSAEEHKDYDVAIVIATILTSGFSVFLFVAISKVLVPYKSPPFTLPFNLATLALLLSVATMSNVSISSVTIPTLPDFDANIDEYSIKVGGFLAGTLRGVSQVFLADKMISAILILVGIGICSRYLLFAAFAGSLLGNGFAMLTGAPKDMIEQGIFGYNSSLTLTAMILFYVPSFGCVTVGAIGVILTVIVQHSLIVLHMPYGLPVMTFPFCIATLVLVLIQGTTNRIIGVPLPSITIPEDHLRRVVLLKDGFQFLLDAIKSSQNRRRLNHSRQLSEILTRMSKSIDTVFDETSNTTVYDDRIERCACDIFRTIDEAKEGTISMESFLGYLKKIGLSDETGLAFAGKAFNLMDLDASGGLEIEEFVAFGKVSYDLVDIRRKIANFFMFVDSDGNEDIEIDELNAALEYLEQPPLSEEECNLLAAINEDRESLNVTDMVNFVTISSLRDAINAYHDNKSKVNHFRDK